MRRYSLVLAAALAAGLLISGCGGKKTEDPSNQITAVETFAETEESTEAETETEAETTAVDPFTPPADAEEKIFYHYEVFNDDESHKVIYWTDGETQKSMPFRSLKLPSTREP